MKRIHKTLLCFAGSSFLMFMTAFAVPDTSFTLSRQTQISIDDQDVDTVPIIYQGRTYLNAREIAPWIGMKVSYDANSRTVNLSSMAYQNSLNETAIMTINDRKITLGQFNAYAKWLRFYSGMDEVSQSEKNDFKEFVKGEIIEDAAIKVLAQQNGIELSTDDYANIDDQIQKSIDKFDSKEDFVSYLYNDIGISYINYYCIEEAAYLRERVKDSVVGTISQSQMKDYYDQHPKAFQKENATVQHILFSTTDQNGDILPYEEKQKVASKALAVLDDVRSGKISFSDAMKQYSDDKSYQNYPNGFVAQKGSVQNEFWRAIEQTSENNLAASIVETEYGYHIVKVLKKSNTLPFNEVKSDILEVMRNNALNTALTDAKQHLTVTYNTNIYNQYSIY